jgi:hypothetical protein
MSMKYSSTTYSSIIFKLTRYREKPKKTKLGEARCYLENKYLLFGMSSVFIYINMLKH